MDLSLLATFFSQHSSSKARLDHPLLLNTPVSDQMRGCVATQGSTLGPSHFHFALQKENIRWTRYIIFSIRKLIFGKFADRQLFKEKVGQL